MAKNTTLDYVDEVFSWEMFYWPREYIEFILKA